MSAGFIIDSPCGRQWFLPREAVRQDYIRFLVEHDGITTEQAEAKITVDEPFVVTWFNEQYIWEEVERDGTLLTATPPPPYLEALNFMRDQIATGPQWRATPAAAMPAPAAPVSGCQCAACVPQGSPFDDTRVNIRMILCATCGNKRCPHATDHRNACTNSNASGQPGSSYP